MPTGHLARNPNDKWIAGVCGGIARWLGWNSDVVRRGAFATAST